MDKTIGTLRQFFATLCQIQQGCWVNQNPGWKLPERASKAWTELQKCWQPITEKELNKLFSPSKAVKVNFSEEKKLLYLPPLEKYPECVPALSLKCHLDKARKSIHLRVMLVRLEEDEEKLCSEEDEKKLCGIGFRLESPHSEDYDEDENEDKKEGRHDFPHAQLIRNFEKRPPTSSPPIDSPCWLPTEQPAFPLIADCPVTLLLCMLLSLYGQKYFWRFFSEHKVFNIERYLKNIKKGLSWKSQS